MCGLSGIPATVRNPVSGTADPVRWSRGVDLEDFSAGSRWLLVWLCRSFASSASLALGRKG